MPSMIQVLILLTIDTGLRISYLVLASEKGRFFKNNCGRSNGWCGSFGSSKFHDSHGPSWFLPHCLFYSECHFCWSETWRLLVVDRRNVSRIQKRGKHVGRIYLLAIGKGCGDLSHKVPSTQHQIFNNLFCHHLCNLKVFKIYCL